MLRLVALLVVVGCRSPIAAREPVAMVCDANRIGRVIIEGGSAADVPQLAVLEGTLDIPARTERVIAASIEMLHARGYARAQIGVRRRAGCGTELVVSVTRGPRFRIAAIGFVTNDAFPPAARHAAIEDALGSVNAIGGAFVEDRLIRALAQLQRRYREAGWLDAAIDPPVPVFDEKRGEVAISISVRAGERFKIGNIVARGGKRSTRAAIVDALGLRGGEWFDAGALRAGLIRVRRHVGERVDVQVQIAHHRRAIDLVARVEDAR